MAKDKMFNLDYQKAFTECILKENYARRQWRIKYGTHFRTTGLVDWDADPDEDVLDDAVHDHSLINNVRKQPSTEKKITFSLSSKKSQSRTIPRVERPPKVMKPIPKDSKEMLTRGTRRDYLKHRYQKPPMQRYRLPIVSSWEHGWDSGQRTSTYCPKHDRYSA